MATSREFCILNFLKLECELFYFHLMEECLQVHFFSAEADL